MTISKLLKLSQIALIASAFILAPTFTPSDVLAAGKGKPSFAGKPEEKLGKGGRSEAAQEELKKEKKKGKGKREGERRERGKRGMNSTTAARGENSKLED